VRLARRSVRTARGPRDRLEELGVPFRVEGSIDRSVEIGKSSADRMERTARIACNMKPLRGGLLSFFFFFFSK